MLRNLDVEETNVLKGEKLRDSNLWLDPPATILTRDRALRTRFILLLRSKMGLKEIAEVLGVTEWTVSVSLRRLLWELAYYLPKENSHEE